MARLTPGQAKKEFWSGKMGTQSKCDNELNDSLLTPHQKMARNEEGPPFHMSRRLKIVHTALLFGAFLGFGLCRGIYGPTLMELRDITGVTLDLISIVFTCLGVGGILGSLVFGRLFDLFNPLGIFSWALAMLALFTFLVPWFKVLPVMMLVSAGHAFFYSGIAVGCNVTILRLWRNQARPVFLTMHLLYTVGGFIAPLLSEPFLRTPANDSLFGNHTGVSRNQTNLDQMFIYYTRSDSSTPSHLESSGRWPPMGYTPGVRVPSSFQREIRVLSDDSSNAESGRSQFTRSRIHFTYSIITGYLCVVTVAICLLHLKMKRKRTVKYWRDQHLKGSLVADVASIYRSLAVILFIGSTISFSGVETVYSGLLFSYAIEHVGFSSFHGSLLVSMLFTSFAIGRFTIIFLSQCVSNPFHLLICDVIGASAAAFTLAYFTTTSVWALWACTILTGLSVSTMYTMGLLWAKDFLPITATFTSLYTVAFTTGMMVWPVVTSLLMKRRGPAWFAYMNVLMLVCYAVCLAALFCLQRLQLRFKNNSALGQVHKDVNVSASIHSIHTV